MLQRLRTLNDAVLFVIITLALTSITAAICIPAAEQLELDASSMLRASVIYAAVVGWQPLVALAITRRFIADKHSYDRGIRSIALRDSMFSVLVATFVLLIAIVVETFVRRSSGAEPPEVLTKLSWSELAQLMIAFVAIVAILWLQAIVEELAWRGYVLPRLMRTLGAWPGLIVHGVVWGLCYAPLFAFSGLSVHRALGYIVTCALLGVVLGWLRLSTRSIYSSAASNATLTICAGLPLLLVGQASRFSAAFQPAGWLPLALVIALIAWHRPWRTAIAVPVRRTPEHLN